MRTYNQVMLQDLYNSQLFEIPHDLPSIDRIEVKSLQTEQSDCIFCSIGRSQPMRFEM